MWVLATTFEAHILNKRKLISRKSLEVCNKISVLERK